MSAFVVDDTVINIVLSAISDHDTWLFKEAGYDVRSGITSGLKQLAQDLHELNCIAVWERYGKSADSMIGTDPFVYHFVIPVPTLQAYKALECLLYQCSEGDVFESPLYKTLVEFKASLASRIIHALPMYETYPWG